MRRHLDGRRLEMSLAPSVLANNIYIIHLSFFSSKFGEPYSDSFVTDTVTQCFRYVTDSLTHTRTYTYKCTHTHACLVLYFPLDQRLWLGIKVSGRLVNTYYSLAASYCFSAALNNDSDQ